MQLNPDNDLFGGVGLLNGKRFGHGNRSRVGDDYVLAGAISSISAQRLDGTNHLHARQHLAENDVATVQPAGGLCGDEELRSVGVLASVGHAQPSGTVVLQLEVLVFETFTVNGFACLKS